MFPAGWAAGLAPVVAKSQTATAVLRKPGTVQDWDDDLEQNVQVPRPPYATVPARIQVLATQARPVYTVGDREIVAQYLITVPLGAPEDGAAVQPEELDLIAVSDTGDPVLDGRTLLIAQVGRGSVLIERDLFCTLDV
jgi:hypothetical protein